ncbi:MAG TPA: hypothetical protein PKD12_15630 [Nitrospira sp.]|nr:hypothetical protein [Nitrospira sp.]
MLSPVEQIKASLKIADLVGEFFSVSGRGRVLTTTEHDSLKLFIDTNTWYWYSLGTGGDLLDWWQHIKRCDFGTALEDLAAKANIELRPLSAEERSRVIEERAERDQRRYIWEMAAEHYHGLLLAYPTSKEYCTGRGWSEETIVRERIGYVPGSTDKPLLSVGELPSLFKKLQAAGLHDHPLAKAVLSIPPAHIVYTHRNRGMVEYLSARSVAGKKHYNLPADLAGERQAYRAEPVKGRRGVRVLVEGQADAISLAQMGIEAVAACGLEPGDLRVEEFSHVAFDNDEKGQPKALEVALALGPFVRVMTWPKTLRSAVEGKNHIDVKDANDLLKSDITADEVFGLLESAPMSLQALAAKAGQEKDKDVRKALIHRFFALYEGLDKMDQTDMKQEFAKLLCGGGSQFQRLWKAYQDENAKDSKPSSERCEYSAGGSCAGVVWEQCINWASDGRGVTNFAVRHPNGEIKYQNTVDAGGTTYIPYKADLGLLKARRVVLFPEKVEEYVNEQQLNLEIRAFIHDFLDTDPFYEKLASYYVMFSWLYDLFENLPYLRALGDYGTGKTRFIQTIGVLCYRPMLVSGASTTSPIFNIIDMFRGTLVIDEADFSNSDADNEIIKILNIGYYKGGVVLRAEKDPTSESYIPNARDVFGPKILATRKLFTDRATESRCLTKRMSTQRPRPGIPYTLGTEFWGRAQSIRNKLLMYRLRNHRPIEIDHSLADISIEPRLNQVTLPLLTLITDPDMRQEIWSFVKAYNEVLISDRRMTFPALVVQALANIQSNPQHTLMGDVRDFSMKAIAQKVQALASEFDPDLKVNGNKISRCLSEDLGLVKRDKDTKNRRDVLVFTEEELQALMGRFGIEAMEEIE